MRIKERKMMRIECWKCVQAQVGGTPCDIHASHDYCEGCGARHDFDVLPETEKTYRCDCGRLQCHKTVPNAELSGGTPSAESDCCAIIGGDHEL